MSQLHVCRVCKRDRLISPSRARRSNWICASCHNRQTNSDPARYLARKLASAQRKRGVSGPHPGAAFVRHVIESCEGRSVLSGASELKRLCVAKVNDTDAWSEDNAVLVTSSESHILKRASHCGLQCVPKLA